MDKMTDYIAWLGDVDFDARPIGAADAMVLCALAYYDMSPVLDPNGEPFYLKDRCESIRNDGLEIQITGGEQGLDAVLAAAAQSKRFGELVISNYVEEFEPERDLQFSAVTFSWGDKFSFIAYRGTDNTLVGWKEDFMIAYTQTEAQKLALEYAKKTIAEPERKGFISRLKNYFSGHLQNGPSRWYLGGHSKGGNLALFASCQLSDEQLSHVEHVYILDGPGSAPEVMEPALIERIDSKTTRILPEYSVVGRLMEPEITDTRIVKSSNAGAMQHAIGSWGIYHGDLALAEDQKPKDRWVNVTLRKWIDNMPYEARRPFVNELFDALAAGGAKTLDDIAGGGKDGLEAIFKSLRNASGTTKELLTELRKAAVSELTSSVIDSAKKTFEEDVRPRISGTGAVGISE